MTGRVTAMGQGVQGLTRWRLVVGRNGDYHKGQSIPLHGWEILLAGRATARSVSRFCLRYCCIGGISLYCGVLCDGDVSVAMLL